MHTSDDDLIGDLLKALLTTEGVLGAALLPVVVEADEGQLRLAPIRACGAVSQPLFKHTAQPTSLTEVAPLEILPGLTWRRLDAQITQRLQDKGPWLGQILMHGELLIGVLLVRTAPRLPARDLPSALRFQPPPPPPPMACVLFEGEGLTCTRHADLWMDADEVVQAITESRAYLRSTRAQRQARRLSYARLLVERLHGAPPIDCAVLHPMYHPTIPDFFSLTPPRRLVALLIAAGATLSDIASAIGRSEDTVRSHRLFVMKHFGLHSRIDLARLLYLFLN